MPVRKTHRKLTKADRARRSSTTPAGDAIRDANIVQVAAALIFRDGKLLITQRRAKSHLGGLWEFPGGKREPGETFEECLVREIREELGVEIAVGKCFAEITHAYPEKHVHLKFFRAQLTAGEPRTLDCAAVKWVIKAELGDYEFPAADVQLLAKLKKSRRNWAGAI
jgi:8-oxo-dGTP diphosphatase